MIARDNSSASLTDGMVEAAFRPQLGGTISYFSNRTCHLYRFHWNFSICCMEFFSLRRNFFKVNYKSHEKS